MARMRVPAVRADTVLAIGIGAFALAAVAALRGAEYDEGYTLLLTAGHRLPKWPDGVFTAAEGQAAFRGLPSAGQIAAELRAQDVHPPLYFWMEAMWRRLAGPSLPAARALSVLFGVASLAGVAAIARRLGIPPWRAVLLCAGCYAFTYTGAVARDFAPAQALGVWGVWLLLRDRGRWPDALAGLAFGLAVLTNYLAAFVAVGCGVWLLATRRVVSFATGAAVLLPAQVWFFLAQHGSREGQFAPLDWASALPRLVRYQGAALFGGLPVYAGAWGGVAAGIIGVLALGCAVFALRRLREPGRALLALLAACPAIGLLVLAMLSGSTPIELRYLAFGTPFAALLLADAMPKPLLAVMLGVQAASIAGLATAPQTMQPQSEAASQAARADALVLVPRGNDGVGIPAAFLQSAPPALRLLVVAPETTQDAIRLAAAHESRVAAALLPLDRDSRATVPVLLAAFDDRCWRQETRTTVLAVWRRVCNQGDRDD
jgi:4-amino-4-deoxy-L-arabinose transferase-like glycosyltransferase